MEFYLETAQLILKLREGIVTDDWTTVREILKVQSDQQSNLPRNQISTAALEEVVILLYYSYYYYIYNYNIYSYI